MHNYVVQFTYALQQQTVGGDSPARAQSLRWVPFLEVRAAMLSGGVLCAGSHFAGA